MNQDKDNTLNMVKVLKYGLMEQNTKVIGEMVWLKAKGTSITQMAMFTPVNSSKIEQMDSGFTYIKMDKLMRAFGVMTCKMDPERKS